MNTANTAPGRAPSGRTAERHLEVLRDPARAAALLDPERIRLMDALRDAPDSASGLARRLGESRQRLNYHLRVMEEAGLVELQEERPRGNFVERVMRPAARHFVLDPGALGPPPEGAGEDPALAGDRFSATHLIALAARTIREVAALRERADARSQRLATAGFQASVRLRSPAEFQDFVRELSHAVAGVVARFDCETPGARPFRVLAGAHPAGGEGRAAERTPGPADTSNEHRRETP